MSYSNVVTFSPSPPNANTSTAIPAHFLPNPFPEVGLRQGDQAREYSVVDSVISTVNLTDRPTGWKACSGGLFGHAVRRTGRDRFRSGLHYSKALDQMWSRSAGYALLLLIVARSMVLAFFIVSTPQAGTQTVRQPDGLCETTYQGATRSGPPRDRLGHVSVAAKPESTIRRSWVRRVAPIKRAVATKIRSAGSR